MGVQKYYDSMRKKWVLKGWKVVRYYETENECNADYKNVFEEHMNNVIAFSCITNMLMSYRRR